MKQIVNVWLLFNLVLWTVVFIRWRDVIEINIDIWYYVIGYPYLGLLITLSGSFILSGYILILKILDKRHNKK